MMSAGEAYTVNSVGPVFSLRLFGLALPFLENDDDHAARIAAEFLQEVPIRWYRKVTATKSHNQNHYQSLGSNYHNHNRGSANDSFHSFQSYNESTCDDDDYDGYTYGTSEMLSCGSRSSDGSVPGTIRGGGFSSTTTTFYKSVDAILSIVDTTVGPAILVQTKSQFKLKPPSAGGHASDEGHSCVIPLTKIDTVGVGDYSSFCGFTSIGSGRLCCDVKCYSFPGEHCMVGSGKKILQFDLCDSDGNSNYSPVVDLGEQIQGAITDNMQKVHTRFQRMLGNYGTRQEIMQQMEKALEKLRQGHDQNMPLRDRAVQCLNLLIMWDRKRRLTSILEDYRQVEKEYDIKPKAKPAKTQSAPGRVERCSSYFSL